MYTIHRNGKSNLDFGVLVTKRPAIPSPEYRMEETEIPGRDGVLIEEDGTLENITIRVSFGFACHPDEWQNRFRSIRRWLLSKEDGKLFLCDGDGWFYKVLHTTIGDAERSVKQVGEFTVNFLCEGYAYLSRGQENYDAAKVAYNPYSVCHPTYFISGNGTCTLTVNGNEMKAVVGQSLVINTDLMLAYSEDSGELQNTAVTGNYEDLYLEEGDNTIIITDGFGLSVIPNWRSV